MIPKIIHRVWIGEEEIPAEYEGFWQSWKAHHPHWEMITWKPRDFLPLRNQREYDEALSSAQRADIARYEILHRHGGIYVDTDFECIRPFDGLVDGIEGFSGMEDENFLAIGLMGFRPRHPFVSQLVSMVPYSISTQPGKPPNEQTGPWLATRVMREAPQLFAPPLFKAFPPAFFYPYRADERYRRGEDFPAAYAVHHWGASWLDAPIPQREPELLRILLRLDWAAAPAADPVIGAFAHLFAPGERAELAVPLAGAAPEEALGRLASYINASEAQASKMADIVLYTDDEVPSLARAAAVDRTDAASDDEAALSALRLQRRRLDAFRSLTSIGA